MTAYGAHGSAHASMYALQLWGGHCSFIIHTVVIMLISSRRAGFKYTERSGGTDSNSDRRVPKRSGLRAGVLLLAKVRAPRVHVHAVVVLEVAWTLQVGILMLQRSTMQPLQLL